MNGKNPVNTYFNKYARPALIVCLFCLLAGVLFGCLLISNYHAGTGYTDGKLTGIVAAAAFFASLLLGVWAAISVKDKDAGFLTEENPEDTFAERILRGVWAAGFFVIPFSWLFGDKYDPLKTFGAGTPKLLLFCVRWSVIFAAIAGIALLLYALIEPKDPNVCFLLIFPASLFTLTYVLRRYLDTSILLNDQRRMISILALAMLSLFLVGEMRLVTGRFSALYYAVTGFGALGALSLSGIGSIVLHIGNGAHDGIQLSFVVLETLSALFVGARLVRVFGEFGVKRPEVTVEIVEIKEDDKQV